MLLLFPSGGASQGATIDASIAPILIEAQFTAGTWTNITTDVVIADGVRFAYGIEGNGPSDCLASPGVLSFVLRNDAGNSGTTQGWYSPLHANVRSGWTFGIPVRVVLTNGAGAAVTSITRVGSEATVTTGAAHGLTTGDRALIAGAGEMEYNGTVIVTVTGASTFTYPVSGSPATPATGTITFTKAFIKFRGKVREIRPEGGANRSQKVAVSAYDGMRDLLEADARQVALQIDKTEDQLIHAIFDALPSDAQPVSREIEAGVDTYPFAFDNVGGGVKAGAILKDVVQSAYGLGFIHGDGTFVYRNRHSRGLDTSVATITDADGLTDVEVPTSLDGVYNHARVTVHPKTVDDTPATVLYELAGSTPQVGAGATITLWGDYRDPSDVTRLIGGTDPVTPLAQHTDYIANDASDGSGFDKSALVTVTGTAFASTVKFEATNTDSIPVYLTRLQLRGRGIYDNGPQTMEHFTARPYGDRPIDIDMPYQDNVHIGQSAATYIQAQYRDLDTQIQSITFPVDRSATLLNHALAREPGDVITVSEGLTGLSSVDAVIHRVEFEVVPGPMMTCKWGLAPASPFQNWWRLGEVGFSELDQTALLGF